MRVRLGAGQQAVERSLALIATTCGSGGAEGALKVDIGELELVLVRASRAISASEIVPRSSGVMDAGVRARESVFMVGAIGEVPSRLWSGRRGCFQHLRRPPGEHSPGGTTLPGQPVGRYNRVYRNARNPRIGIHATRAAPTQRVQGRDFGPSHGSLGVAPPEAVGEPERRGRGVLARLSKATYARLYDAVVGLQ
jgi:hypothetical protein